MNAAIYARYSSELQRATSIQDQIRLCRQAAERLGYTVADEQVLADHEISGTTVERPGYRRLLELARAHAIDAIIVEAQDRLWRSQAEMHTALARLRHWQVRVICVSTNTDLTDRAGVILATVVGLKDELFLSDLRDKTRRGLEGAVVRGLSAGGRAFGYRSEPVKDSTGSVIGYRRTIDPAEAEVVRYIYQLYANGLTPRAIAHRLNKEGVAAPRAAQGRRGGSWAPSTIHGSSTRGFGILNNPIYCGRLVWNRSVKVLDPETGKRHMRARPRSEWTIAEAPALRIVPQNLWEKVRARRGQRAWTPDPATHGSRPRHLLSGLMLCAECGGRFIIKHHRRGVRHYGCAVHADRGSAVCTNNRVVRQDVIEQKILAHIFGGLFAPHRVAYLERAVDAALARALQQSADTSSQREAALRQARHELENIAAAIRAGILTPTTKTMLEDAERRVTALEAAMSEARRRPAAVVSVRSTVERYLQDLRGTLGTNIEEARRLLSTAVDKIVIRREGKHLIAQVIGNFAGMFALEPDLCASVGAGRGFRLYQTLAASWRLHRRHRCRLDVPAGPSG